MYSLRLVRLETLTLEELDSLSLEDKMSRLEQYIIPYEDRDELHTSRWLLEGVNTKSDGNTYRGWLFMKASDSAGTVTIELYKDPALGADDKVAEGTADISGVADAPAQATLAVANDSGLSGSFYFESYTSDPAADCVPVLACLCTDADLAEEWYDLDALPPEVYSVTEGMAAYCGAASKRVLLLVSQMYAEELGGYGGREHVHYTDVTRTTPDWRRLITPDQLKDAATCWALELAFGACHKMGETMTMYSGQRDHYAERRKDAISAWNLTFNLDPDGDEDADAMKSASSRRVERI